MKIEYIHEPTDLQCGQAVLAMVLGIPVGQVCAELGNERETTLREMREYFVSHGVKMAAGRSQAQGKEDLPRLALLSLETPRCWHWSLYADGVFYDPEHGVLDDFPECNRKYFWELNYSIIKRLQNGEKILCPVCKKHYYDVDIDNREYSNYFHCEDPDCKGSVHVQKALNVE